MANALTLPHILEITFDSLTAVVGVVVLLLALRVAPTLTLFAHRRALWISIGAAALIVASQMAEVWAKGGKEVDWQRLMSRGFQVLARR